MKSVIKLIIAFTAISKLHAIEVIDIENKISITGKQLKVLDMLVALGLTKRADWKEASRTIQRTSGDLGETSFTIAPINSNAIKAIVLVGKSPESHKEDPNIAIFSVSVETFTEIRNYAFSEKAKGYSISDKHKKK